MQPTVLASRRRRVLHTYVTDDGRHGITAADAPTTIIRTTSHRTAPRRRGAAVGAVVGAVLFVADLTVLAAIANGEVLW